MSPPENDDYIEAGADLLLKGWKMLNKACPTCFQPLYEQQGEVVCVKCKKDYVLVDSISQIPPAQSKQAKGETSSTLPNSIKSFDFSKLPLELKDTAKTLIEKINVLNNQLKESTDPNEIAELSSAINSLVNSLRSLAS
ncbi:MAG: Sjogren's syndrome/scleroderma autoantigen 1 family protein [Candidatus Heimdallarchaeaceae archaeon]|jgi:uncharacterized Zn finger protein (UPF0148 family)